MFLAVFTHAVYVLRERHQNIEVYNREFDKNSRQNCVQISNLELFCTLYEILRQMWQSILPLFLILLSFEFPLSNPSCLSFVESARPYKYILRLQMYVKSIAA